jgi:hypothetical protein
MHDEYRVIHGEINYLQEYMGMSTFNEIFGGKGAVNKESAADDPEFAERFPTLHLLMTHLQNDTGGPRQVCTLTIVCEDGQVKCGINERNLGLSLWVSAGTIGGVFASLEEALQSRPVAWRRVTWKGRKGQ